MRFLILTICLIVLLFACAYPIRPPPGPPAYQQGYTHGCESASNALGDWSYQWHKNPYLYQDEPLYKQGWDDGYEKCKTERLSIRRATGRY
jgi:hypothetical protein